MLPWGQDQALPAPDTFGLMVIGFGMVEVIPGETGIGRIRVLVMSGSLVHGEKGQEDTNGGRVVGNSHGSGFYGRIRQHRHSFAKNFLKVFLVEDL